MTEFLTFSKVMPDGTPPDVILEEHCCLWEEAHGMQVSPTTMSRAMRRVGWTRKKNGGRL